MRTAPLPTQARLTQLFKYDPSTGKLYWNTRPVWEFKSVSASLTWNRRFAGKEAFTATRPDGYRCGSIDYKMYQAHRIIYKMVYDAEPEQIDHLDRNRSNNAITNLAASSAQENSKNSQKYSSNTSGHVGVSWDTVRRKWTAQIRVNYKVINLGRFMNIDDAIAARAAAEVKYNFNPNHGK